MTSSSCRFVGHDFGDFVSSRPTHFSSRVEFPSSLLLKVSFRNSISLTDPFLEQCPGNHVWLVGRGGLLV